MAPKPFNYVAAFLTSAALAVTPIGEAFAGNLVGGMTHISTGGVPGGYGGGGGGGCHHGGKIIIHNKWINIYKPITITKTIDNSKNININKSIVINKGSVSVQASAFAFAGAQAQAISGGGGYVSIINKGNLGGEVAVHAVEQCIQQDATVVKAIHPVCVDQGGREYPASHMIKETWVDASYEGEVARCIAGSHLKAMVGDVLQSDQGMAGTYKNGDTLTCKEHEALVHYRGGMLKCAPAKPVKDCTERTNLRQYGSGDMFFSYRANVCVIPAREASASAQDVGGMPLDGGVGGSDSGY